MKSLKKISDEQEKLYEIEQLASVDYIEGDIVLMEDMKEAPNSNTTRVSEFVLFLCTEGEFAINLNGNPLQIRKNELLLCKPNVLVGNYTKTPTAKERCIVLSAKYADQLLSSVRGCWDKTFYISQNPISRLSDEEVDVFCRYFDLMRLRISKKDHLYRKEVIRSLLQAFLYDASDAMNRFIPSDGGSIKRSDNLFRNFIQLVERTNPKNRSVVFYSKSLNVTSKYLSAVCKETTGKTASGWIHLYAIEEIKSLLNSTDKSIKEIAFELNFPNTSFFGRYVKKYAGVSPKDYRNSQK